MDAVRQEMQFRLVLSCFFASVASTVSLVTLIFVFNLGFIHPWKWATKTFMSSSFAWHVFVFLINTLCITAMTIIFRARLSVADKIACKYYQVCVSLMSESLNVILAAMLVAGLNTYCILSVIAPVKYYSIFSETHMFVFNQRTHCLVSCGTFMGLLFCLTLLIFNRLTLIYSQPPTFLVDIMREHTISRALATVGRILYFIPIYVLLPKPFCAHHRLSVWFLFLDVRLLVLLFAVGFHLQFSWGCAVNILKWQFTRPIEGNLEPLVQPVGESQETLIKSKQKLEQHLALEHLADLVATSSCARASVFSLSSLGGRPVVWRQVSGWCISLLEQFTTSVQNTNNTLLQKSARVNLPYAEIKYQGHLPASLRAQLRHRMKSNATSSLQPSDVSAKSRPLMDLLVDRDFPGAFRALSTQVSHVIRRLPGIQALNTDVPYSITANLFAGFKTLDADSDLFISGQAVIWATEVLACLTLASYTEDMYGSAQRSLGRILVLFVDSLEAVERHLRLVGLLTNDGAFSQRPSTRIHPMSAKSPVGTQSPKSLSTSSSSCVSDTMLPDKLDSLYIPSYYRFSSDPSLPWRMYATLNWAVTNTLSQFGEHLGSVQMSQKAKDKLQQIYAKQLVTDVPH
ncbi:hypothetical protein FGIG_11902 [Fasciola gigantica]|uniref:Nucleoporin NDC1 n=1 Tax=Fasciola gigantica TaxID=46835 RepID=A0A504YBI2_FASGI|nr:hypothetical protein FGIG_11902 [Fasciola gigantica]